MMLNVPFGGLLHGARPDVLAVLMRTGKPLTGRQIHALVEDRHSLWAVQEALKGLADIGLTTVETVGRAGVHRINERHEAVAPLRALLNPLDALTRVVAETVGPEVEAVVLFGSVARGDAVVGSDVDLAVIAPVEWDGRVVLEDALQARLGTPCDIVHLTVEQLGAPESEREPVVAEIVRDGVALVGTLPRMKAAVGR